MGMTVELRTEIPGPNSRAIVARKERVVAAAKTLVAPVVIDRGAGCTVTDVDGNTFLDWSGGIGCLNVGHTNPRVTAALHAQVDRFLHTDFTILPYESYVELAERLVERTPIRPKKAAFFNSGAEAVENAVKIARHATGRHAVIAFEGAFHGRTLMAMSLTSKQHPYKAGIGVAPEVYLAPFPEPVPLAGLRPRRRGARRAAEDADQHTWPPRKSPPSSLEPVQGEGGLAAPPVEWVQGAAGAGVAARDRARRRRGAVRVRPHRKDVRHRALRDRALSAACGESIAAGVPMSGVVGRSQIVDAAPDSSIGGTFVGSPLGCVAGLAVIEELEGGLLERGVAIGERIRSRFEELKARFGQIGEVRGLGPMLALEFVQSPQSRSAAPPLRRPSRSGAPVGSDPASGRRPLELHPGPGLARCHRRADRRGARHPRRRRRGDVRGLVARRNVEPLVLYIWERE